MLKKVLTISVIVAFIATLGLTGAGCKATAVTTSAETTKAAETTTTAAAQTTTTAAAETTTAKEKPLSIYYVVTDTTSHPFWRAQAVSMTDYAKKLGVDLTILDAGNNTEKQTSQVDTVVTKKPDAVIYCAVDTGVAVSHIKKMKDAGIPVVNNNRQVPGGAYDVQFSFDEMEGAAASANMIVDFLKDKYGEAKGKILEMQGALTDENAILRSRGLYSVTDTFPNVHVITKNTGWDLNKSAAAALDAFQANPDIDAIYLQSDYLLPTILNILKNKPLAGKKGHIFVVSLSGDSLSLSLIKDGTIDATFNMNVIEMALLSFDFAIDLTKGVSPKVGATYEDGKPWGPIKVFAAEGGGVKMNIVEYPVTIDNVEDTTLWGNQYKLD